MFFSCSSAQQNLKSLEDKIQKQALINTRKAKYIKGDEKILFAITYINAIEHIKYDKEKENFILSLHVNDGFDLLSYIKKIALNKNKMQVQINQIDANSSLAKYSPTYTKWGKYYLIQAPLQRKSLLKLSIEMPDENLNLEFVKDLLK